MILFIYCTCNYRHSTQFLMLLSAVPLLNSNGADSSARMDRAMLVKAGREEEGSGNTTWLLLPSAGVSGPAVEKSLSGASFVVEEEEAVCCVTCCPGRLGVELAPRGGGGGGGGG